MGDWFEKYGLDRDPFTDRGVHGLFFPGGRRAELQTEIEHLARFGNALVLVLGASGIGKSALAAAVGTGAKSTDLVRLEAGLMDTPVLLMRSIAEGFGVQLSAKEPEAATEELAAWLVAPEREGRQGWLLIDDAHHLDPEATAFLCALRQRLGDAFGLVMFAESQWEPVLRAQMLAAQDLHVVTLDAFDREETVAYISYRMKTAGLSDELPFSVTELAQIANTAHGVPAVINRVARQLLQKDEEEAGHPAAGLPLWHIGVVGATLVALLLLYLWGSGEERRQKDPVPQPSVLMPPAAFEESVPEVITEVAPEDEFADDGPGQPDDSGVAVIEEAAPSEAEARNASPYDRVAVPSDSTLEVLDTPASAKLQAMPALEPDEEWLLSRDGRHFTMQLISSDDAAAISQFRGRYDIEMRAFRKLHKGMEWQALVHGDFPDRKSATAAVSSLPGKLRETTPWIRSLASIQAEIRAARGP